MPVLPIVRYMLLCKDWRTDADSERSISVFGLVSNYIRDASPQPNGQELCVVLILTECYRPGRCQVVCVWDEDGSRVFASAERFVDFPGDPLAVHGVSFRLKGFQFPRPGVYSVQFHFNGQLVEERPITAR